MMSKSVLVTGGAGFIGSTLVDRLLKLSYQVTVIDNFNDFYDPHVKRQNITEHLNNKNYTLIEGDIRDRADLSKTFSCGPFDTVVHLAAMAGVRPSLQSPAYYMDVNVLGTQRLIDQCLAQSEKPFLLLCSSSSVYGERSTDVFVETDLTDKPMSPYAASKVAAEAAAYSAHSTTGLQVVCVRPFTVYGPRQRPDLAIYKFCHLIEQNKPIELFGDGSSRRDYTFVEDIVSGIYGAMNYRDSGFEIINLGRSEPVTLMEMIASIERALGKKAELIYKPMQTGDVPNTFAGIEKARRLIGYNPQTSLDQGIQKFVDWYHQSKLVTVR